MAKVAAEAAGTAPRSDTRERILRGALSTFAEKGFEGATTREIATRAGVNLGLLQYHVGGKQKLWQAAVALAFGEMRSGATAILDDSAPSDDRERLRALIHLLAGFVSRNPEFVRIMHHEGKRRGPRMRWLVDRHVKPAYAEVTILLERAQASGVLPANVAPAHLLYVLVGSIDLIFHQAEECKRLAGFDPTLPEAAQTHARAVEFLLLGPPDKENSR
jgi:TetR/AcrR family transcriptional regulator